ncbi:DEKNAAC101150 [Brettanomyces naardenensis]|uniref:DEKNAAC101150 n=1 Tax=Brettanomyces naardenensis TaxID=13370 RepID=A0A448YHI9_BRENA|nr:DEKNAAC101150 [Brettanomyces naardenensis]
MVSSTEKFVAQPAHQPVGPQESPSASASPPSSSALPLPSFTASSAVASTFLLLVVRLTCYVLDLIDTLLGLQTRSHGKCSPKETTEGVTSSNDHTSLFPSFGILKNLTTKDLKSCGTSRNSGVVPFTNSKGEVEFKLVDQQNPQQPSPISDVSSPVVKQAVAGRKAAVKKELDGFVALSPVSSVKSSASETPALEDTPISEENSESGSDSPKMYECPYCKSKFRIRGYLTRHMKKHSKRKAYRCPFYDPNAPQKCHSTGGFSRRDTYKTHLKARHFRYPPGIRSGKRTGAMGWCGICGEKFVNNEVWVERHIELGLCPGLPAEYVKNLKIGKKKTGKHSKLLDVVPEANFYHEEEYAPSLSSPMSFNSTSPLQQTLQPQTFSSVSSVSSSSPVPSLSMTWQQQKLQTQPTSPTEDQKASMFDSKSSDSSSSGDDYDEEDYPSLDAECSPYICISYPAYFYKNVNDSENPLHQQRQKQQEPTESEVSAEAFFQSSQIAASMFAEPTAANVY